ncbi:hypothetical protein BDV12DRAFT_198208 [Aspergillus spectabilis]
MSAGSFTALALFADKLQKAKVPWGLAIYRTTYTPFSDAHFAQVLELITTFAKYSVRKWTNAEPNDPALLAAKPVLQETYEPIVMNDKSEFDGMTMDAIRTHHQALVKRPVGERPITDEWFCVLVDEEVMQSLAGVDSDAIIPPQEVQDFQKYWVKAVESDPEDEDDEGWMKCSVYGLWNLWDDMNEGTSMHTCQSAYPGRPYVG